MPLIQLRNKLIYPGGNAGFVRGHLAETRGKVQLSAVSSPGGFINLVQPKTKGVITGTATRSIKPNIGSVTTLGVTTAVATFTQSFTSATLAGIFIPNVAPTAQGAIVACDTPTLTFDVNLKISCWNGSAQNVTTAAVVLGVPYFAAMSQSTVSHNIVFRNLLTGRVFFNTFAGVAASSATKVCVGNNSGGTQPANAGIAAVMVGDGYMSLTELLAWADDPWGFWYPATLGNAIALSLGGIPLAANKQIDADLPPRAPVSTPDLRTSFQAGFISQGPGRTKQDADLPPLGRGPSTDLRTSAQDGFITHGPKRGVQSADLPPLGHGPSVDLLTSVQPGFIVHGAKAGNQDADLPPRGHGPVIDLSTAIVPANATPSGTVALSGSGALASAGTISAAAVQIAAVTLTGAGALASAGAPSTSVAAAITGAGALASAGSVSEAVAQTLTGAGALASAGTIAAAATVSSTVALTGAGTLASAGAPSTSIAETLTGAGALASAGTFGAAVATAITGASTLASAGAVSPSAGQSVALIGARILASAGSPSVTAVQNATVAITGTGTLVSAGTIAHAVTQTLTGAGALASAGTPGITATQNSAVTLTGAGTLASAGAVTPTLAGGATVTLIGAGAHASAGMIGSSVTVSLSGARVGANAGSVAPRLNSTVAIIGAVTGAHSGRIGILGQTSGLSSMRSGTPAFNPPPTIPAVPKEIDPLIPYLRNFSIWSATEMRNRPAKDTAVPHILMQTSDNKVFKLVVKPDGTIITVPVSLGDSPS